VSFQSLFIKQVSNAFFNFLTVLSVTAFAQRPSDTTVKHRRRRRLTFNYQIKITGQPAVASGNNLPVKVETESDEYGNERSAGRTGTKHHQQGDNV